MKHQGKGNGNDFKSKGSDSKSSLMGSAVDKAKELLINDDHEEGETTKTIEEQTSKVPSGVYLALAIGSMILSGTMMVSSRRSKWAHFVGLWAPCFLILGVYNKIVKTHEVEPQSALVTH